MPDEFDYCFKVILIGNSGVGKTSLLTRFADEFYSGEFIPTIGVDFKIRKFPIDDKIVRIQFWDTAGQETFRSITTCYFRCSDGVVIVYDVCKPKSFYDVAEWMQLVKDYCTDPVVTMIIGNKSDSESERKISYEQGQQLAAQYGVQFAETSAQADVNVRTTFLDMVRILKQRGDERALHYPRRNSILSMIKKGEKQQEKEKSTSCCAFM